MKYISVLGITGSIGLQCVDIVKNNPDKYRIVGACAGVNIAKLEEVLNQVPIDYVSVLNESDALHLKTKYPHIEFYYGEEGYIKIATLEAVALVLSSIVGFAGLKPTIAAIKAGKDIALANKETLVVAGHIITKLIKEYKVKLLPVDSEHSAIFQSLESNIHGQISRIILTASGGSFRDKTRDQLKGVSVKEALNHPNWSMGAKITIDSATMFNKGLEIIEAKWLFNVDYDQIDVVIHPESILHSAVEFDDTAIIGQFGLPDMRVPIQLALSYPKRDTLINSKKLDFSLVSKLTFYKPDLNRFKAIALALKAGKIGGSMPCVLNAANEIANELFRNEKIEFLEIEDLVEKTMDAHQVILNPSLEQLYEIDNWARNYCLELRR